MRTVISAAGVAVGFVSFVALSGCGDKEFVTVEKQTPKRPIGDSCVVDSECETTRCVAGACSDNSCTGDDRCLVDEICVLGECADQDTFECEPDQAPLLSLSATHLEFEQVAIGQSVTLPITITNIGNCLLNLSSAGLLATGAPGFSCDLCDPTNFPQRIPPQRTLDVNVTFSPPSPGEATSELVIDSDDLTAGDDGEVHVTMHADYDGVPSLVISPPELNFGFVEFQAGGVQGELTQTVEITNRGTGNAALVLERIFVDEGLVFSGRVTHVGAGGDEVIELDAVSPDSPITIAPYDANDPSTIYTVEVTFRPDENDTFEDRLVVRALGDTSVPVALTGNALGAPILRVSTNALEFKCQGQPNDACGVGEAYPIGFVAFRQIFVYNDGLSEMPTNVSLSSTSGDFTVSPSFLPPIAAGSFVPLTIIYNPSVPSDPANPTNPQQSTAGFLNVLSPTTGELEVVSLNGFSRRAQDDAVLKIEMTFENADNSWAGNDFRDVDVEVENPVGLSCAKNRSYISDPNNPGQFIIDPNGDLCDEWNLEGNYGTVNWIALGVYEEPERVVLFGLGPVAAEGQEFTVKAHYMEDCANIPTGLLADILGLGGSILLGVLGGAIGVPIAVNPADIADTIANNCFDHASSLVTMHISIDGVEVAAPQVRLNNKGDTVEVAHLRRTQGTFCDTDVGIACP